MATAQSVINDVARTLIDQGSNRRWSDTELLDYLNEGLRAIVTFKPSSYMTTTSVLLVAGCKQTVPSNCSILMDIGANMGTNGTTHGRVATLVDRKSLDNLVPRWRTATQQAEVFDWMYDTSVDPKVFYVYPPNTGTQYVELIYSVIPTALGVGDTIPLDDMYLNIVQEYMLFRSFEKDSDAPNSFARSQAHLQTFQGMLGVKLSMDQVNSPNVTSEPALKGTR